MGAGAGQGEFVGREADLATLGEAFRAAQAGAARTVIVAGEAGIGKTRLVDRFTDWARSGGGTILEGAVLRPGGGAIPYAPFVEALRDLARSTDQARWPALLGPGRVELARLIPEFAARGPASGGSSSIPAESIGLDGDRLGQARLFEAVLAVVERLAAAGPVVLVLDDIQWADEGTRGLLGFLARGLRSSPTLVLVTLRTDGLAPRDPVVAFLAELERDDGVTRLDLGPLDRSAVGRLLAERIGRDPRPAEIDDLVARSDGNPFFVEELADVAATTAATTGATAGAAAGHTTPKRLPSRLRDVLTARFAGLPDETQAVLRVAAAAGPRFDDELLVAVMGWPDAAVAAALRDALDETVIVRVEGGYAFRHALLREVAEATLLISERERLHGTYARELARRGEIAGVPVTAAELADHWDAADVAAEARAAHLHAGLAAEHVYAFADARRHYERALAAWPEGRADPDPGTGLDRPATLQRAAECAVLTGDPHRAVALGRMALEELGSATEPDPLRLGALQERMRWYLWESGDVAGASAAVAEALRLIPATPPSEARARALAQAAGIRLLTGAYDDARDGAAEALTIARAADAQGEEALALGVLGWASAALGDVDAGIATYREGLELAERLGGAEGVALAHANLAALLDRVGRTEASLEAATGGVDVMRRIGVVRTYGGVLFGHAAKALFDLGRLDDAASAAADGLALDPEGRGAAWLRINAARVDLHQGRFAAAGRHLGLARLLEARDGVLGTYRPPLLAVVAELAAWEDRLDDVRAAVDEALALIREDRPLDPAYGRLALAALRAEADAAAAARLTGDGATVEVIERRVQPIVERLTRRRAESRVVRDARGRAVTLMGEAELGRLSGRDDPASWAGATAAWSELGRPVPAAYAGWRHGAAVLAARGPREEAAVALRNAARTATGYGGEPLLARIELLARHARIALDAEPETGAAAGVGDDTFGLTERETEVLRLVAAGWSNQQIADALFITRKTASVHVSNILGKFGVRNRVEAAAVAHRLGLAAAEPPPTD